jgi:hypothetical protein
VTEASEQFGFFKEIASRLDAAGIRYMLTGSMAMSMYTTPRMTRDIDLVIECEVEDSEKITELFEADCYVDHDEVRNAIEGESLFNIINNALLIKADFIVRKDEEYRRVEFDRRREFHIETAKVYVTAPEDLVLSKLRRSKDSSSELQYGDVKAILKSGLDLDWLYMDKWARTLGLDDLLSEAQK